MFESFIDTYKISFKILIHFMQIATFKMGHKFLQKQLRRTAVNETRCEIHLKVQAPLVSLENYKTR